MNTLKHIEFKLLELKYLDSYVHLLRQLSDTMDTYNDDISEHYTFTKRFLEIKDDKEFLNFISKNAREYYEKYLSPESSVEYTLKLLDL
jgi:hypothetical protein